MGTAGTDAALVETDDVVLMAGDLTKLLYAISLGRKERGVAKQNMVFAVGVIVVLIAATLLCGVPLPLGVVGHEGNTLLVITDDLRLLGFRKT